MRCEDLPLRSSLLDLGSLAEPAFPVTDYVGCGASHPDYGNGDISPNLHESGHEVGGGLGLDGSGLRIHDNHYSSLQSLHGCC